MTAALDDLAVFGAGLVAGGVNALAGGGTIVSFPTLLAIGLSPVRANVTNTVALSPGYLAGTYAQRRDLVGQTRALRPLLVIAAVGGMCGSILLLTIPSSAFHDAIPYLLILASVLLAAQEPLKRLISRSATAPVRAAVPAVAGEALAASAGAAVPGGAPAAVAEGAPMAVAGSAPAAAAADAGGRVDLDTGTLQGGLGMRLVVFLCSVYGGFFGAGLGIMMLAVLGLFSHTSLARTNVVKQALSFTINVIAALFFCFTGKVEWVYAGLMAVASIAGATAGGRFVHRVDPRVLRVLVVLVGVAVAVRYWA